MVIDLSNAKNKEEFRKLVEAIHESNELSSENELNELSSENEVED